MGVRGPAANVFATPAVLGPRDDAPVRVPDSSSATSGSSRRTSGASRRRCASWRVSRRRLPRHEQGHAGYDVLSLTAGANPPIDPAALPDPGGSQLSRTAVTGDIGAVYRLGDAVNLRARYGRSYGTPTWKSCSSRSGDGRRDRAEPARAAETGNNTDVA